jgi:hypothetical protein
MYHDIIYQLVIVIFIQVIEPMLHKAPGGLYGRHEYLIDYQLIYNEITAYLAGTVPSQ